MEGLEGRRKSVWKRRAIKEKHGKVEEQATESLSAYNEVSLLSGISLFGRGRDDLLNKLMNLSFVQMNTSTHSKAFLTYSDRWIVLASTVVIAQFTLVATK